MASVGAVVRRGRPAASTQRDVRSELLAAARAQFLRFGYRAVSSRQVAVRAGVDPAMVQYYFRNKRGLYVAMLEEAATPLRALLDSMNSAAVAADPADFLDLYMRTAAANPWIPALLVREVLPSGGPMRDDVVRAFLAPMAARLRESMRRAQTDGRVDEDTPTLHALVSLMSLAMWPFLVRPLLERVLDFRLDERELEGFIAHTMRVFRHGLATGPRRRSTRSRGRIQESS